MSFPNPTIVIGSASARAEHAGDLGKTITVDGKTYRLVRAAAAITAAANKVVISAVSVQAVTATAGAVGAFAISTASTSGVAVGDLIYGPNIPADTFVTAIVTNTSITFNKALTAAFSATASAYVCVQPYHQVDVTTTAASPGVAGVIPPGQTGSTGTTGLISGDYFYVQVGGIATPICTTASLAAGTVITTHTTSGESVAVSVTYAATTNGVAYAALMSVGSAVVSQPTPAKLQGLI